jgi:hypothetical protein
MSCLYPAFSGTQIPAAVQQPFLLFPVDTLEEALSMAREGLSLHLSGMLKDGARFLPDSASYFTNTPVPVLL